MKFIALFIFYIYSFSFCSSQILSNINDNGIFIKYKEIESIEKVDTLINFLYSNKLTKIYIETYSNGQILFLNDNILGCTDSLAINFNPNANKDNQSCVYSLSDSLVDIDNDIEEIVNFNPLVYLFNNIDKDNIKIYAYFDVYKLWDKNYYPEDSNHYYYKCLECLEYDKNGKSDKSIKLDQIQSLEWEGVFLSPLHPNVNEYLIDVFNKIIDSYSFDGVVFDNLRYQNYYYGYNEIGIENFKNKYEFDPNDINRGLITTRFGYSKEEADSISTLWDNYRIEKITDFLYKINNLINKNSFNLEIGAFVNNNIVEAKNKWYQDWISWIDREIVDFIIVDDNTQDIIEFNYNYKQLNKLNEKYLDRISIGINLSMDSSINIANKILLLRLSQINSISLYYFDQFKNFSNWYEPIFNSINFNLLNEK